MTYAMRLNDGALMEDGEGVSHVGGFTVNVIADGTGFGNPEPLVKTMNTLMTQGSWETSGAMGNRAPALVIEVEGDTADGLNAGEVWLSALMHRGQLEWLPPGQTVWTVFDVMTAYIERTMDARWDLDEKIWVRYYRVPIKALPYARSPQLTITPAEPPVSTPLVDVLVNDGSSATGWSGAVISGSYLGAGTPVTPTVVSGAVRTTRTGTGSTTNFIGERFTFAAAIPVATPYLRVDLRAFRSSPSMDVALFEVAGSYVPVKFAWRSVASLGGEVTASTAYYLVPDGATAVRVLAYIASSTVTSPYLEVDQIRRVSRLPDTPTGRQKVASLNPGGSAPADGSLHVGHATSALGKVVFHTYPLGRPTPALMQYRTSAAGAADATMINNAKVSISAADLVLTVPDPQLPTHGRASLWAKIDVITAPSTVTWTVTPTTGGTAVGQVQTGSTVIPLGSAQLVPLGLINLPGAVTGPAGAAVITLRRTAGTGSVTVDEVWAFAVDDDSALTIVDTGSSTPASGGSSNHMWINAPTPERPAGEVLIGTSVEDARWPAAIQASEIHKLPAEGVSVLTVTTNASDASTDFTHYKRWTHHAAETS